MSYDLFTGFAAIKKDVRTAHAARNARGKANGLGIDAHEESGRVAGRSGRAEAGPVQDLSRLRGGARQNVQSFSVFITLPCSA
jgi:hypothetical protein